MDETLICIIVFLFFSYYSHNILEFSYKSMFEIQKPNQFRTYFHPIFLHKFFSHFMCS